MIRPNLPAAAPVPRGKPRASTLDALSAWNLPDAELTVARDPIPEPLGPRTSYAEGLRAAYPGPRPIPVEPEGAADLRAELALLVSQAGQITREARAAVARRDYAGAARLRAEWEIVAAHARRAAEALHHPAAPASPDRVVRASPAARRRGELGGAASVRARPTPTPGADRAS